MKTIFSVLFVSLLMISTLKAQREFEQPARALGLESMDAFKAFLALANDAALPEDMVGNIAWAKSALEELNFDVTTLQTSALPLLVAEQEFKKGSPTIAF